METMFDYIAIKPNTPDMSASIEASQNAVGWDLLQKDVNAAAKGATVVMTDINRKEAVQKAHEDKIAQALQDVIDHDRGVTASKQYITGQEDSNVDSPDKIMANVLSEKQDVYNKIKDGTYSKKYAEAYLAGISSKMDGVYKQIEDKREGQGTGIVASITSDAIRTGNLSSIVSSIPAIAENLSISNNAVNQGVVAGVGKYGLSMMDTINYKTATIDDVSNKELEVSQVISELNTPYHFGSASPHMQQVITDTKGQLAAKSTVLKGQIKDYSTSQLLSFRNGAGAIEEQYNKPQPPLKDYVNAYGRDSAVDKYNEDIKAIRQNKIDRVGLSQSYNSTTDVYVDNMMSPEATKERKQKVIEQLRATSLHGDFNAMQNLMEANPQEGKAFGSNLVTDILSSNDTNKQLIALGAFTNLDNNPGGITMLKQSMSPTEYTKVKAVMFLAQALPTIGKEGLPNIPMALEKYEQSMSTNKYIDMQKDMPKIEKEAAKYGALYPSIKEYLMTNMRLGKTFDQANALVAGDIKGIYYKDEKTNLELIAPNGWSAHGINKQFLANSVMNDLKQTRFKNVNPDDIYIKDMSNGDYKVMTKNGYSLIESTNGHIHYAEGRETFYKSNKNLTEANVATVPSITKSIEAYTPQEKQSAYQIFNTTYYKQPTGPNSKTDTSMTMATGISVVAENIKAKTGIDMKGILIATAMTESSLGVKANFDVIRPGKANGLMQITKSTYGDAMKMITPRQKAILEATNTHLGKDIRSIPYEKAMNSPLYSTYAAALVYARKEAESGIKFNYSTPKNQAYIWKKYYNTYKDTNGSESMFLNSAYGTPSTTQHKRNKNLSYGKDFIAP